MQHILVNGHSVIPIHDRSSLMRATDVLHGLVSIILFSFLLDFDKLVLTSILEFSESSSTFECTKW